MGANWSKSEDHHLIPPEDLRSSELVIVLIGHTGESKAAIGNVILGYNHDDPDRGFLTKAADRAYDNRQLYWDKRKWRGMDASSLNAPFVTVINTPGYPDGLPEDSDFKAACVQFYKQIGERPHIWLWVKRAGDPLEKLDFDLFKDFSRNVGVDVFCGKLIMVLTQSVYNEAPAAGNFFFSKIAFAIEGVSLIGVSTIILLVSCLSWLQNHYQ
jgi:predicted GTPase